MCGRTRAYHERQVNEHAFRVAGSEVRWAVIISTISYGKQNVDSRVLGIFGGALPSRRLTIALLRCQITIPMRSEVLNSTGANSESSVGTRKRSVLDNGDTRAVGRPASAVLWDIEASLKTGCGGTWSRRSRISITQPEPQCLRHLSPGLLDFTVNTNELQRSNNVVSSLNHEPRKRNRIQVSHRHKLLMLQRIRRRRIDVYHFS